MITMIRACLTPMGFMGDEFIGTHKIHGGLIHKNRLNSIRCYFGKACG